MIVIPMAGLSKRFFLAGYRQPKYMLNLHGFPVFDHALGSFASLFQSERFVFVCRDVFDTPTFVRRRAKMLGLDENRFSIVVLCGETGGQAETVAIGLRTVKFTCRDSLTIFNIDTFRTGFSYPLDIELSEIDGYLEVFFGKGDHWSFIRAEDGSNRVIEVAEKIRISNLCSDGLYFFRSADLFLSLFAEIEGRHPSTLQGNEYFVAPLYNGAIQRGCDIRCSLVDAQSIRLCGTPEEYLKLVASQPFSPLGDVD